MARTTARIQHWRDRLLIVVAVFGAVGGLSNIPLSLDFLDPISSAIADFDITDLAQSQFRDESAFPADTTIVLVNIGELDRAHIAEILSTIATYHPRVVGIDAFFRSEKNPTSDSLLEEALRQIPMLVLPCELLDPDDDATFDTIATSHHRFHRYAHRTGFANVITSTERAFRTVRYFSPAEQVGTETVLSFPLAVTACVDSAKVATFLSNHSGSEEIAYRGNTDKFYVLDWNQILADPRAARIVRDKIVLLGYLGPQFTGSVTTLEDAFFTPLNDHYVGRSFPDMYGVVIHANVISQVLHQRSIEQIPEMVIVGIALVLCWINVGLLTISHLRLPMLYDGIGLVLALTESALVLFLTVYFYHQFTMRIPTTVLLMSIALTPPIHELYMQLLVPLIRAAVERMLRLVRRPPVISIVVLGIITLSLHAQEATILNMRGPIRIVRNGTSTTPSVGIVLLPSDQIQLQSGAAVTLVTSDGRSVRLTKPGTMSVHAVTAKARSSPIAAKFAQYVFKEATSSNETDENYRRTMKVTGAVDRAVTERRGNLDALDQVLQTTGIGITTAALDGSARNLLETTLSEQLIVVAFPHTTYHMGDTLQISWFRTNQNATYRVTFRRSDGSIAAEQLSSDTTIRLVRSAVGLQPGIPYYWRIQESGTTVQSPEYCIVWLRQEQEQQTLDDLRQIESEFADDPALAEQLKARYLEDAGIHTLAALSYAQSAQLCNCTEYRRILVEFLRRYNYLP